MMNFRGLELHGGSFWDHNKIERALDLVNAYDLTALVIHYTDFMTEFLFPKEFFNPDAPWKGAPARRGENALHNNRAYFSDILKRARRKGVDVWLEVKEITFSDEIIEKFPEVVKGGVACPTDPLWPRVVKAKYRDLVDYFPDLKGVIVSAGSPEGKVSLSQKKCACDRCSATELTDWYLSILNPMYEVLSAGGLRLSVREFSYNLNHQVSITDAVSRMPDDTIYCIKVTPHDFYPTFPDNSLVAQVSERPKWIEYDTMGQYYGWGIIPCTMREDIDARFSHARTHAVEGALLRVEWERINDYWSLDGINRINLHAAAQAAVDAHGVSGDLADLVQVWLQEEGIGFSPEDLALLSEYLKESWPILKKSLYVHDFVLNDSSMVPLSIERAWWSMTDKHSLAEWFPERAADLELDERKVLSYIDEKKAAHTEILTWRARLNSLDISSRVLSLLREAVDATERYVRMHLYYGRVCLLAGWIDQTHGKVPRNYGDQLDESITALEEFARGLTEWLARSDYPHQVSLLFNADRCLTVAAGARRILQRRTDPKIDAGGDA